MPHKINSNQSILIVAAIAAFVPSFMATALNLALPAIGVEFEADAVSLGWVLNSFALSTGIFLLISGRLGDLFGRVRIFFIGMILFTLTTLLLVFSQSITMLLVIRVFQGITSAMVFGTIMAIVTGSISQGERGMAVGINLTSTYTGLSLGPLLGGLLIQHFGWRSVFLSLIPFLIITIVLIKIYLKDDPSQLSGGKFDFKGSVVYAIALLAFMYGFSELPSFTGWVCLGIGLVFGIIFIFMELKTKNPIFEFRLILKNRMFAFSSMASIIIYTSIGTIGFFNSLYLQHIKNLDATTTGLIMITQPLGTALLSVVAGKLSDRINPGILASIGMGIVAIGLFLFSLVNEASHIIYMVSLLAIIGLGFGLFSSPNTNAIMSSVENKYLGIASGTLGTMRTIGQMLSMGTVVMLFSFFMGREVINPSIYPELLSAIRAGFLVFSILCGLGVFVSLARNKRK